VGSSLFLKNKFGLGYHLNFIGSQNFNTEPIEITELVKKHVSDCKLEKFNGKEVNYNLPIDSVEKFESLFQEIEETREILKIENVAISMTTLEEVFLKLAEEADSEKTQSDSDQENRVFDPIGKINKIMLRSKMFSWIPVHVYGILKLRFTIAYRNKYALIYRFITPIPALILTILLPKLINRTNNQDPK
ncbi:unnamed protein product, partial [Brachionus calyciflorus]